MLAHLRISILMLLAFSVLTGIAYPLVITGVAQVVWPHQANGSLIPGHDGSKPVGSELIGQPFDDPNYFWCRPSATTPQPYNAGSSTGSNLAVTNPAEHDAIHQRIDQLHAADVAVGYARPADQPVPIDLITASGSGLDPHISVAAAEYQVPRVAKARGLTEDAVRKLVREHTEGRQLGVLGEPRVNVLQLNLALDALGPTRTATATSTSHA